jgi:SAM-dependent methyltransferase
MQVDNEGTYECCPLCKAGGIHEKGKLKYRGRVTFSTSEIELAHLPELWKCRRCMSGFVQHSVDAETAKMLYSTGQAGERWSTVAFDQNKTRSVIDCMAAIFQNKGSVLDVGCNTGELLDFARGFGCKTTGVEFSSASREVLAGKGHSAYSAMEEATGEYDVIAAFDLVEHLHDVPAFIKTCRSKLADTGKLVILTGNIGSLSAVLAGTHWWYAQYPEHIVFPSHKYFADFSGMRIESWIPTYASKGYQNPIYRIGWSLLKGMLRGKAYTGLPSLGPDHVLVVLGK